jgi:uroporphyrinogen decarboxylase
MPEYDFIFGDLVKNGILIHFHSCGCVDAIAGDLAEIGISILNPVQAKANDLDRLKRDTLGKMALSGAVDTATILMGTPEEVRNEVIRVMRILKPGGGYICAPDQYFPNFPQKNMDMLKSTAIEFGKY